MQVAGEWNIFVSYSHVDRRMVSPITELIRVTGIPVFRDEDSIQPGKKWRLAITESISACRTVLVFWSVASSDSKAVEGEYRSAIDQGKDIVPVLLDDTPLSAVLSEYQWIDLRPVLKEAISRAMSGLVAAIMAGGASVGIGPGGALGSVVGMAFGLVMRMQADGGLTPIFSEEARASVINSLASRIGMRFVQK
jgi:hypothetical protein